MTELRDKRVLVTGGAGMLGQRVVRALENRGCRDIVVPRRRDYDLTREQAVVQLYHAASPDVVNHLAGLVRGIGANRANPGRFLYDNLVMGNDAHGARPT